MADSQDLRSEIRTENSDSCRVAQRFQDESLRFGITAKDLVQARQREFLEDKTQRTTAPQDWLRAEPRLDASSAAADSPRRPGRYRCHAQAVGSSSFRHHRGESDDRLGDRRTVSDGEQHSADGITLGLERPQGQFLHPSQILLDAVRRCANRESAVYPAGVRAPTGGRRRRATAVLSA